MSDDGHKNADDLREVVRLLVAATTGVTDVVEAMHRHIGSGPKVLGQPLALPTRIITKLAYGSVRGVTRVVGGTLDVALEKLGPLLGESSPSPERATLVAALNGVLGDWLAETKSALAIPFRLERVTEGRRVLLLIHGSSMHEGHWAWKGHHHGEALARDHGWALATVRYNSGLPVLENGRLLAAALDDLGDVDELAILAHSMGGLVARAAIRTAEEEKRAWRSKLKKLVTLGTPHTGSPIERMGHLFESLLPISDYSAPLARLGKIRSAGVMDLRHGLDFPLPENVECWAVAAAKDPLVPVASAHGPVPADHCTTVAGIDHLELLGNPDVYSAIERALGSN
jgi:pimeloyl-ACP methyl ester carboxylesterase